MPQRTQSGRVIGGRYRLVAKLGSGGFGRVWKAHDEVLHADVAVKEVWLPPTVSEAEQRERLTRAEREARNAAKLRDHPHVVAVHDVVIEDDTPWIVMRLVVGQSLQNRVEVDGPVSVDEATRIADALLSALGAAHAADIVHRDIKPANVMLADATLSGAEDVLLTDFGIAVHKADTSLTASDMIVGSAEYSAPERLRSNDGQTASDLFCLGLTLYFAVEGISPFRRATIPATITAVLMEDPPPAQRAGHLTPLITGLLNKNPAERPTIPQAQDMLNPPPAPTAPPAPKPSTLRLARPHPPRNASTQHELHKRLVLSVVTLVVLAAVGGLAVVWTAFDQASTDKTPQTADALLPRSFTDSMNAFYTLRSSGVQNCLTGNEQQDVQRILESVSCTNAIVGTYVDYFDKILVSVWVVPLADAPTASVAASQLRPLSSNSWGFLFPQQGAGALLAIADPQYLAAATQSGYTTTSHRYLINTAALPINLTQNRDPSVQQWLNAAARRAAGVVGPALPLVGRIDQDDLATITSYIRHTIRRLGDQVLDLDPPNAAPTTRLELEPRALFPG